MRKKAKYNNKKINVNGVVFDSMKEYKRYVQLKELEEAGAITDLQRQVKYVLIPAQYETYERYGKKGQQLKDGKRLLERECAYVADFVYKVPLTTEKLYAIADGKIDSMEVLHGYETVVEDVKGYRKKGAYDMFTVKRKLMLYVHGIRIKEV